MKKANNKSAWRFEKGLDAQELLERLTVAELYLLAFSCHPSIWEAFVKNKGLNHASRAHLTERVKNAIQEAFPQSLFLLSDCLSQITNIIEKNGVLLQEAEKAHAEELEAKLKHHVWALKTFLPLLSPLALLRTEGDDEPAYVKFVKEQSVDDLTLAEQKNCFACSEWNPVTKSGKPTSFLIRIMKGRNAHVKLVCKKRHVPSRYLSHVLVCAILHEALQSPPKDLVHLLMEYLFGTVTRNPAVREVIKQQTSSNRSRSKVPAILSDTLSETSKTKKGNVEKGKVSADISKNIIRFIPNVDTKRNDITKTINKMEKILSKKPTTKNKEDEETDEEQDEEEDEEEIEEEEEADNEEQMYEYT